MANRGDGTVTKLRASDDTVLGAFNIVDEPYGIAFDGENVWVTGSPETVVLRASDGAILDRLYDQGNSTTGIAFDGANVWVSWLNINAVETVNFGSSFRPNDSSVNCILT